MKKRTWLACAVIACGLSVAAVLRAGTLVESHDLGTRPQIDIYFDATSYLAIEIWDTSTQQRVFGMDWAGGYGSVYTGQIDSEIGNTALGFAQVTPILPASGTYEIRIGSTGSTNLIHNIYVTP